MNVENSCHASSGEPLMPCRASALGSAFSVLLILLTGFYALSIFTLPFADDLWFGEIAVLAFIQLPKMFAFNWVQDGLMMLMRHFGLSSGSPSPDMIASKPWALAIVFIVPSMMLICVVTIFRRIKQCRYLVFLLLGGALVDSLVTIWFDQTSIYSLF